MASVDGKAMRNVKGENGLALMLVNVFAHDLKLALAEKQMIFTPTNVIKLNADRKFAGLKAGSLISRICFSQR